MLRLVCSRHAAQAVLRAWICQVEPQAWTLLCHGAGATRASATGSLSVTTITIDRDSVRDRAAQVQVQVAAPQVMWVWLHPGHCVTAWLGASEVQVPRASCTKAGTVVPLVIVSGAASGTLTSACLQVSLGLSGAAQTNRCCWSVRRTRSKRLESRGLLETENFFFYINESQWSLPGPHHLHGAWAGLPSAPAPDLDSLSLESVWASFVLGWNYLNFAL